MPPAARQQSPERLKGHGQDHNVIDLGVNCKEFISRVYMPNMKSRSHRLKVFSIESSVKILYIYSLIPDMC